MLTIYIVLNTRNVIVLINLNITEKWHSIVRLTLKQILLDLKLKIEDLVLTHLSISIVRVNIRQIAIATLSRNTNSIESSM